MACNGGKLSCMIDSLIHIIAVLSAVVAMAWCQTEPSTRPATAAAVVDIRPGVEIGEDETARHAPTGLRFPAVLGEVNRLNPHVYDQRGHNVSTGYTIFPAFAAVTIYIYPLADGQSLEDASKQAVQDVEEAHPDWISMSRATTDDTLLGRGAPAQMHTSVWRSRGPDMGLPVPVESSLAVALFDGSYLVKVRATYPAEQAERARPAVAALLEAWRNANDLPAPDRAAGEAEGPEQPAGGRQEGGGAGGAGGGPVVK